MKSATTTVLLVEDNIVDVEAVRRAFTRHRIANPIVVAEDGQVALDIIRGTEGRPPLQRPYLVLLDLNLPRVNGFEVVEALRADPKHRDTVIFVLSTSDREEDLIRAYGHNVAGYISKGSVGEDFIALCELLSCYWRVVELPVLSR